MKILIVDDDVMIRRMLQRRLSLKNHTTALAENGKECLDIISEFRPDIVLLDMHMPIMDGYETVKTLRDQYYKGLVIAVTASAASNQTHRCIDAGCDYYIPKPVKENFEELILQLLQKHNEKENIE
jgi:CheY-like chemotaxis protein